MSCLITPPAGFKAPQTDSPDGSFDIVCTFEPTKDGQLELTKLGDTDMEDGTKENESSEYPSRAQQATDMANSYPGQPT